VLVYASEPDMALSYDTYHAYNLLFRTDTRFLDEVLPEPLPQGGTRVLDLGCGTGRHLAHLGARGYEVTGLDLSPHMLREAAERLDREGVSARLVHGDICRVGDMVELDEQSFDAAICMFSTLGLVRGARRREDALAGWWKLLRPGGTLVVHTHNLWHNLKDPCGRRWLARRLVASLLPGRQMGDKRVAHYRGLDSLYLHIFSLRELRGLLRSAGYRVARELLLDDPRTGPIEGRFRGLRANGFLIAAKKV
jgi:SAM-dependent methyltransferase